MEPVRFAHGLIIAALLALFGLASVSRAADDDTALRRKAMALNDITGDKPILAEIQNLVRDPSQTRKLLHVAVDMAKEKEQPFNYNGAYILARTALQLRDYEASKVFYQICADQASKLQSAQKLREAYGGISLLIEFLYKDKKYEESRKVSQEFLETLERQGVSSALKANVLRQMARAMVKQGKIEEANKLVDNLLKARENDWRNLELKAWLQNETGHAEDAVKTYKKVLDRIAENDDLQKEDKTEAQDEVGVRLIRLLIKLGKKDEAGRVMDDLLKGRKDDLSKLELKAGLQEMIGRYSAALKTYEDLLERIPKDDSLNDEQKPKMQDAVRELMVALLIKMGKADEANRLVDDVVKGKKDDLPHLESRAKLQQLVGQYAAAAKSYEELLGRISKEESLTEEQKSKMQDMVRYALSNVYVELGQIDKAAEELKSLLAKTPDSPSYNNDLGYIWADHDRNLEEAEKLIRKAIDEDRKQRKSRSDDDKDNAAYLDSLGWVLFKQKKYQDAKKYLLEATNAEEGDNIEIYDHLADVYMALGDKGEALATWKKALTLEIKGFRELQRKVEIEKKLKAKE
jgi:tetratricopeptide (TPR) repeat protein